MPNATPMLRFVDDELARTPELVARMLAGTQQLLRDPTGLASGERATQLELAEALRRHAAGFEGVFGAALRQGVADEIARVDRAAGSGEALELMDEARVEADIAISRATQLIDTTAEWELRELQTFTSTLAGQAHVSAESNPLRPLAYASALWQATGSVSPDAARRALLLRTAAGVLAGLLKNAWAAACTRLEAQGIEPGVYRTVLLTPALPSGRAASFDITQPGGLDGLLAGLPQAGGQDIDADAQTALALAGGGRRDRQVVELMSRLFARIQADREVPAALRAILSRLQLPALRIALRDPGLLGAHDHPVWVLMDRIAALGAAWPQPGDPRAGALLALCDREAEAFAQADAPDAAMFRRALGRLGEWAAAQLDSQRRTAQPAIEALERSERRDLLEHGLSQRLTEQMAAVRTSPAVRRFVTGTWARVLAQAMQDDGEHAESTQRLLKTVDDLLWSVQIPDHAQSRQRLLALLPGLLQRLREGMALIAWPEADQRAVLDELMAIHTEALRPGARAPGVALTPEQIVQRLRDEVIAEAPAPRPFADSLLDLSSIDTVPADVLPPQEHGVDTAPRLDAWRPGDWRRLYLRGRWSRVQLLWRSERGAYLLFAGEAPGRTQSVTQRALERLNAAGLLQPLAQSSLVQRAVDAMQHELSLPG